MLLYPPRGTLIDLPVKNICLGQRSFVKVILNSNIKTHISEEEI